MERVTTVLESKNKIQNDKSMLKQNKQNELKCLNTIILQYFQQNVFKMRKGETMNMIGYNVRKQIKR